MKLCLIFMMGICCSLNSSLAGAQTIYEAEPNHSTIGFSVPIAGGLTRVTGKFTDFTIEISNGASDIAMSTVAVKIQAGSIDTGIQGRDDHLKSPDFFHAEKFPQIMFESREIIRRKDQEYIAVGDFTMHGITQEIELPFTVTEFTLPGGVNSQLSVSLRWTLNRKDYGVGTGFIHDTIPDFIGADIGVEIDFWTRTPKSSK
jgi:polyisoprenoid-binding protein YceI